MATESRDIDIAAAATLFGDPARAAMLTALADGRALPAGELARIASVSPSTATAHLRRLIDGGLIEVSAQGRHKYHRLASAEVSTVLEALAQIAAQRPVISLRQHRSAIALAEARTCYDHLAGRRGVELRDRLLAAGALRTDDDRDYQLTCGGERLIAKLGIDLGQLRSSRRIFARSCLDWTQRKPHLAGALPAALTSAFLSSGWIERATGRGLRVSARYDAELATWLYRDKRCNLDASRTSAESIGACVPSVPKNPLPGA
ncbi:MAG: winged helix-turn-helix domain-containing protein [Antricoccus sp.]